MMLLVGSIALIVAARGSTECRQPHYSEGAVWERSNSEVFMAVSIPLKDFVPRKLVCLAHALRQRYSEQQKIKVLIFSSQDAAERYMPYPTGDYGPLSNGKAQKLPNLSFWLSHLHGSYSYDGDKHEEHIDIRPFGSDFEGGPDDTRISLPVTETPRCHLEMAGRCLLELEHIAYPDEALTKSMSGTVTLTGLVEPSGKVTGIDVAGVRVQSPATKQVLVDEAVRNLETWKFEPVSRKDQIRITYSFVIDSALAIPPGYRKFSKSQLELPNEVIIRGRSSE
jgi:TonB family protein